MQTQNFRVPSFHPKWDSQRSQDSPKKSFSLKLPTSPSCRPGYVLVCSGYQQLPRMHHLLAMERGLGQCARCSLGQGSLSVPLVRRPFSGTRNLLSSSAASMSTQLLENGWSQLLSESLASADPTCIGIRTSSLKKRATCLSLLGQILHVMVNSRWYLNQFQSVSPCSPATLGSNVVDWNDCSNHRRIYPYAMIY